MTDNKPIILAIESSTDITSVALFLADSLMAVSELVMPKLHATHLTALIANVFDNLNISIKDLSAIAVSKGPGSYTGIRIGASVAKGMALSHNISIISVDTLHSFASQVETLAKQSHYQIFPMLDARRQEVYGAIFDQNLQIIYPSQVFLLNDEWLSQYTQKYSYIFLGDGAVKNENFLSKIENKIILTELYASAKGMGKIAYNKFIAQDFENINTFEPVYLKEVFTTTAKKFTL